MGNLFYDRLDSHRRVGRPKTQWMDCRFEQVEKYRSTNSENVKEELRKLYNVRLLGTEVKRKSRCTSTRRDGEEEI